MSDVDVAVIGAGLAGLRCARVLVDAGLEVGIWEAGDDVGGRIRTDHVDGFLVDRGFQLLNPAYPAVRRWVDVDALDLRPFGAGVAARLDDRLALLGHPLASPRLLPGTLRTAAGSPKDLVATARWLRPIVAAAAKRKPLAEHLRGGVDVTLRDSLDRAGVHGLLRTLLERFYAGVVLEDDGTTSYAYALLLARTFAAGVPSVPATGMQTLPRWLASGLEDRLHLGQRVEMVGGSGTGFTLRTPDGRVNARRVVVATGAAEAEELSGVPAPLAKGVVTHWFASNQAPSNRSLLHVDGRSRTRGPVVNAAVMSLVAPTYAPPGQHLVQVSALLSPGRPAPSERAMREHAGELFGAPTVDWRTVARHEVQRALPSQPAPLTTRQGQVTDRGLVVCGDHRDTASIQGALVSGDRAARAVLTAWN